MQTRRAMSSTPKQRLSARTRTTTRRRRWPSCWRAWARSAPRRSSASWPSRVPRSTRRAPSLARSRYLRCAVIAGLAGTFCPAQWCHATMVSCQTALQGTWTPCRDPPVHGVLDVTACATQQNAPRARRAPSRRASQMHQEHVPEAGVCATRTAADMGADACALL